MSLYIYGVTDTVDPTPLQVSGIQGERPRFIDIETLRILVSDYTGTSIIPTKESALSHERVVEALMDQATPLPFRFGSVVSEEKLREFVRSNQSRLKTSLEQVRGCVEMGLKIIVAAVEPEAQPSTGTDFLRARKQSRLQERNVASWVESAVAGAVRRSDVSSVEGTVRPVVRIAHLVPRPLLGDYRSRVDELVQRRTDHRFLRSGPWPPYSFVAAPDVIQSPEAR